MTGLGAGAGGALAPGVSGAATCDHTRAWRSRQGGMAGRSVTRNGTDTQQLACGPTPAGAPPGVIPIGSDGSVTGRADTGLALTLAASPGPAGLRMATGALAADPGRAAGTASPAGAVWGCRTACTGVAGLCTGCRTTCVTGSVKLTGATTAPCCGAPCVPAETTMRGCPGRDAWPGGTAAMMRGCPGRSCDCSCASCCTVS